MFNVLKVPPHQRDVFRFFWPHQSDFFFIWSNAGPSVMCTVAPVALQGPHFLIFAVSDVQFPQLMAARHYIEIAFYVDDGIYCTNTIEEALELLKGAAKILKRRYIRLQKLISNEPEVQKASQRQIALSLLHRLICNHLNYKPLWVLHGHWTLIVSPWLSTTLTNLSLKQAFFPSLIHCMIPSKSSLPLFCEADYCKENSCSTWRAIIHCEISNGMMTYLLNIFLIDMHG